MGLAKGPQGKVLWYVALTNGWRWTDPIIYSTWASATGRHSESDAETEKYNYRKKKS
jgi:hypothetical protein